MQTNRLHLDIVACQSSETVPAKGDVPMVTGIDRLARASEQASEKGVTPWMIFMMRRGSLSPLRSFQRISAEIVPAIISAMRSETRSAAAIRAASNLVI
jgi:hypothetical protein